MSAPEPVEPVALVAELVDELPAVAVGDVVIYRLGPSDVDRLTTPPPGTRAIGVRPAHIGGGVAEGATAMAHVSYVYGPNVASLYVLADGSDGLLWCPSRIRGTGLGEWSSRP